MCTSCRGRNGVVACCKLSIRSLEQPGSEVAKEGTDMAVVENRPCDTDALDADEREER
jgi:hypothetical protein